MFSVTARNKTRKDSREEKTVKRLPPGEENLPVGIPPKQNTLKLPKLQGKGSKAAKGTPLTLSQATDTSKKTGEKEGREDSVTRLVMHNNTFM